MCGACAGLSGSDFYPRPPRGGRLLAITPGRQMPKFLSTPSARRATGLAKYPLAGVENFYPRPPRGGRHGTTSSTSWGRSFLSTPSARRATCFLNFSPDSEKFLSTPSARRATNAAQSWSQMLSISIHALREEGDLPTPLLHHAQFVFLSTPSARRATHVVSVSLSLA